MYIIPKPKQFIVKEDGFFLINWRTRIVFSDELRDEVVNYARIILECIEKYTGLRLLVTCGAPKIDDIYFSTVKNMENKEYSLISKADGIYGFGQDKVGVLYAIETLCQIIQQQGGLIPEFEIHDKPDFLYRGYYLDQSRGRVYTLNYLKKLADRLARYKINQLQLYIEHTYLFSDLSEMWRNETPLLAPDIMELDRYCNSLNIELVPSLSSFGHLFTLLNSKSYNYLSEMDQIGDPSGHQFSFYDRMQHHTVNVSDKRVIPFIEGLLEEYMTLFTSDKFNLCADETFDLGKGKSKKLAEEKGVHRIYIDYVRELSQFLVSKGKTPMFWGDIICGEPDLVKELPENIICLNWGYAPEQLEEPTKKMAATGVKQYICPGVCGWNQWMNLIENSYKNITRMCGFARKYNAIGVLNTDWGDFGHVNEPEYAVPGMIYGAAFSWNGENIDFDNINKAISRLEYDDGSEKIVGLMAKVAENITLDWCNTVFYYEKHRFGKSNFQMADFNLVGQANINLDKIKVELMKNVVNLDSSCRKIVEFLDLSIDCIKLWNNVGEIIKHVEEKSNIDGFEAADIAEKLECWFMKFKFLWRQESREGDLAHIGEIVFWYCDWLRDLE